MATVIPRSTSAIVNDTLETSGPILVATDGTDQSDGALALAQSLAKAMGRDIGIVAVQPSLAIVVPEAWLLLEPSPTSRLTAELRRRVRVQCARMSATGSATPLPDPEVENGEPERVITRLASERGAGLIVVGIGRHSVVDRMFGSETALKVARLSRVPMLAVPAAVRELPHRAVVGLDFSEASLHAAQETVHLMTGGGVVHLVHVIPRERALLDPWISDREYAGLVRHRFARFRARLVVPPNVEIAQHTCTGSAAKELVDFAECEHADLIAAGSHGHGFVTRFVLGSSTTALLRAATCSVLIVPPAELPIPADIHSNGAVAVQPSRSQWGAVLADFTHTNAGRRTRLEVDDPEIGAQAQESEYPLRGITFDPHDQRLEIMLGELGAGQPHLSRSISGVSSLDVLTDKHGNDLALRARHGLGQTVLTFVSP